MEIKKENKPKNSQNRISLTNYKIKEKNIEKMNEYLNKNTDGK